MDRLLGLDLNGGLKSTKPPVNWNYTVPGTRHHVLVLDCRTRRSFQSRVGPPGNIGVEVQGDQIPNKSAPDEAEVVFVVSSLQVLGPPSFDALIAPLLFRATDVFGHCGLQRHKGTRDMTGTDPDAIEAWGFDPDTTEALLKRLERVARPTKEGAPRRPVVILSGDVHYSASTILSYWRKKDAEPLRIAQLTSSGFKNVMKWYIPFAERGLSGAQLLARAKIGAERLGWESRIPKLQLPPGVVLPPAVFMDLHGSPPALLFTASLPTDTKIVEEELPDWSWRLEPVLDQRPHEQRPELAQPLPLARDVTENLEGYRQVALRHQGQLKRLNNARQLLLAPSLGLVSFQRRTETLQGQPQEILDLTHALYTTHPNAVDRDKAEPYTVHVMPLRAPLAEPPEKPFRPTEGGGS